MAANDSARPPSGQAENGEEVLLGEGDGPGADARRQADQIAEQRQSSDTASSPSRQEGQRQREESGGT